MFDLRSVQVETTNLCNGACVFCPHEQAKVLGTMSEELYRKIVDETATLPSVETFLPLGHGEPFMDPDILPRIEYARGKLDEKILIKVFTNGVALNEDHIQRLNELKHVELSISVNGIYPGTRKAVMGQDDTQHVLEMWHYAREVGLPVVGTMVAAEGVSMVEQQEFVLMGGCVITLSNWAGSVWEYHNVGPNQLMCDRAKSFTYIMWTGQVALCCFDPFGKVNFGNVGQNTIKELWETDKRQYVCFEMEYGDRTKLELCKDCVK